MLAKGYETWWLNEKLSIGLSAEEYLNTSRKGPLVPGTIQVALLRQGRCSIWIYVHPKMALSTWRVELAL